MIVQGFNLVHDAKTTYLLSIIV